MYARFVKFAVPLLCLAALPGCALIEDLLKNVAKPTASVKGVKIDDISFQDVTLLFDIEINNPYRVPLPLLDLGYSLATTGTPFLSGKKDLDSSIPASSSKVISLPAKVNFKELFGALKNVRPGMIVPYTAALELGFDPPGLAPMTLPLEKKGELPVPAVPKVKIQKIEWKSLSLREASAVVKFRVDNANDFPFDITKLKYSLSLAGAKVGETGISNMVSLESNKGQTIDMPISFSPAKFGLAIFNVLRGEDATYAIDGAMELKTRFGVLKMPLNKTGKTPFIK